MPVIAIPVNRFNQLLGQEFDTEILQDSLEQLGCDVEGTADLTIYNCPRCGAPNDKLPHEDPPKRCDECGHETTVPFPLSGLTTVIRLSLVPARPDLLDTGGLTRALRGYLGIQSGLPRFDVAPGTMSVATDPALIAESSYRPFIVAASMTMPPLDAEALREIMRIQENLHWGIGRDRKLTSIGVYNLDTVVPPFIYRSVGPDELSFHPLGCPEQPMTPRQILERHPKGVAYAHLLANHSRYPLLTDSVGTVLSMPPIINSEETRVQLGTSRLFIDVTGVAREPVINTLNTLVSSLLEFGGSVESVHVQWADGTEWDTPRLEPRTIQVNRKSACQWIGVEIAPEEFLRVIAKMRLAASGNDPVYNVQYPVYRTDVRHEVDIFEDVAIGYGYSRIPKRLVETMTPGRQRHEEKLANQIRQLMTGLGFNEIMSLTFGSIEDLQDRFRLPENPEMVLIANAKTRDQGAVRPHLMLGLLTTLGNNWRRTPPVQVFECGNVVLVDPAAETGTREEKRIGFAVMGPDAGYADIRSVLDAILREMGQTAAYAPVQHPTFISGRCAAVDSGGIWRAVAGEVHPEVLNNFGIPYPVALAELAFARVV